ncbi:MAG TPA: hypothetical protein VES20_10460 [Bryobacteraceae bacterium]|nr:hypothetical protein [Bryobacteraceae bacterium]
MAVEKEKLVADHWAAERAAVLVLNVFWHLGACKEYVARPEGAVRVVIEADTVEVVRSGLDSDVDRCAAGKALLRVHAVRYYIDRFDRFQRRHVRRVLWQPDVRVTGSIDTGAICALCCTVNVSNKTF